MRLALAAMVASGCSLAFVRGPSSTRENCTTADVAPVLDTVGAILLGSLTVFTMLQAAVGARHAERDRFAYELAGMVAGTAAVGTSAMIGYHRIDACEAARQ